MEKNEQVNVLKKVVDEMFDYRFALSDIKIAISVFPDNSEIALKFIKETLMNVKKKGYSI